MVRRGDVRARCALVGEPRLDGCDGQSYRARWNEAEPDPRSATLEATIKATKQIDTPTMYISGTVDGVNPPEASKDVPTKFSGPFEAILLDGVGHFPPREAPDAVAAALTRHFGHDLAARSRPADAREAGR